MIRLTTLLLLIPSVAFAQDAAGTGMDEAARAAFVAGSAAYDNGDYEDALTAFSSGYSMSSRPDFLFNIASCYDRLHRGPEAVEYYERYLADMPEADNRDYAEDRIVAIRASFDADVVAGPVDPLDSEAPAEADLSGAWISLGVAALGLVTFAIFGAMALSIASELNECRPERRCVPGTGADGEAQALIADIGLGVGVVGIALGIVLWVTAEPEAEMQTLRLTPTATADGGALLLDGAF